MLFIDINDHDFDTRFSSILSRSEETSAEVLETVRGIINVVRTDGDTALLEYTNRFDSLGLDDVAVGLELTTAEIDAAVAALPEG
jgi:histidinol dehydrogenase